MKISLAIVFLQLQFKIQKRRFHFHPKKKPLSGRPDNGWRKICSGCYVIIRSWLLVVPTKRSRSNRDTKIPAALIMTMVLLGVEIILSKGSKVSDNLFVQSITCKWTAFVCQAFSAFPFETHEELFWQNPSDFIGDRVSWTFCSYIPRFLKRGST